MYKSELREISPAPLSPCLCPLLRWTQICFSCQSSFVDLPNSYSPSLFSQQAWHSLMSLVASITWSSSPSRWWAGPPAKTLTEPFLPQLGRVSLEAYR